MKKIAVTLTATLLLVVATSLALQSVEGQQSTLTFAASQNLGPCCFWAGTPQISVSGVNVYIVWSQIHDIMFRGSSDNGATYGPVITLASYTDNELVFSPKLIGAGSGVLVAWLVANETNQTIFYRRSVDNGLSWGPIVTLSFPGREAGNYDMSISGNNVYVAWSEFSQQDYTDSVIFRRSIDRGASFGPRVTLEDPTDIGYFTMVRLAASNSTVHVFYPLSVYYSQDDSPKVTTYYRRSLDDGATFETQRVVATATWGGYIQLAVSGSRVFLLEEVGIGIGTVFVFSAVGIFLNTSTDNGSTWRPQVTLAISNSTDTTTFPSDPQMAVSGSNVYVAWQVGACGDIVEEGTQCEIFFRRSTSGGLAWTKPAILSNSAAEMQSAASDNNVYIAWVEQADTNTLGSIFQVFIRWSMNKGATFETKVAVSGPGLNQLDLIGASGKNVYVIWTANGTTYTRQGALT